MYCVHCGKQIKDDARFCSFCGAPVEDDARASAEARAEGADSVEVTRIDVIAPEGERPAGGFAGQMEQDRKRSRRKLSPLMIVALVLALLAGTALAAVLIVQQANQGEQATQQASQQAAQAGQGGGASGQAQSAETSSQSSETAEPERELTTEEQVIKSLDGWWQIGRVSKQDHLLYFHDGTVDVYSNEGQFQRTARTIAPSDVTRADNGVGSSGFGGPGYYIYGVDRNGLGLYLSDNAPNALSQVNSDGSGYSGGDTYTRIDPPSWAASISNNASQGNASAQDAAAQSEANDAAARQAAIDAGKQVFEGTVRATTFAERAAETPYNFPEFQNQKALVLLDFGQMQTFDAYLLGNHDVESITADIIALPDDWAQYDGQHVVIAAAASDLKAPADTQAALYAAKVDNADFISPSAASSAGTSSESTGTVAPSGDYVLPDSNTRRYSRAELEKMDLHTLFLARNEIFARHGAGFKKQELRDWFGSKSWYHESIPAGSYGTEILNDVEKDNALLMRDVETARNSPYLG